MITRRKFHTEDPQFWSGLCTSLLPGSFCSEQVNWHTSLLVRKNCNYYAKILCDTQDFVARVTRRLEFVHFWTGLTIFQIKHYPIWYASSHIIAFKSYHNTQIYHSWPTFQHHRSTKVCEHKRKIVPSIKYNILISHLKENIFHRIIVLKKCDDHNSHNIVCV